MLKFKLIGGTRETTKTTKRSRTGERRNIVLWVNGRAVCVCVCVCDAATHDVSTSIIIHYV